MQQHAVARAVLRTTANSQRYCRQQRHCRLQGAALAALAAAAPLARAAHKFNVTGTDILNFALQLECLEGEFYSWAAFGEGLTDELLGGGPASIGGRKANLTDAVQVRTLRVGSLLTPADLWPLCTAA